jgi:membrane protein implicated in regulation of membrane protease activity
MKTIIRYLLFQIPQWLILAVFLWLLVNWNAVPRWAAQGFLIFWVIKDFIVFPLVRGAYDNNTQTGVEKLIGAKAVAQEPLDPEGYVKINGELWKARADPAHRPIEQNRRVQVRAASGLTLIVSATE